MGDRIWEDLEEELMSLALALTIIGFGVCMVLLFYVL